jgi:hypothetical protein
MPPFGFDGQYAARMEETADTAILLAREQLAVLREILAVLERLEHDDA